MVTTTLKVTNREIKTLNGTIYTGNHNVDTFKFIFDSEWDGLDKTLKIMKGTNVYDVALLNDEGLIPDEAYGGTDMVIGVIGTKVSGETMEIVLSTSPFLIPLSESVYIEGEEPTNLPTPTQWDLYIAELNRIMAEYNENAIEKTTAFNNNADQQLDHAEMEINSAKNNAISEINSQLSGVTSRLDTLETEEAKDIQNIVINGTTQEKVNKTISFSIPISNVDFEPKNNTATTFDMSIDNQTYIITFTLKNSSGTALKTGTIDLPLESVVVSGTYDNVNKKIVLTLENGNTVDIPVGDLIAGLVPNTRTIAGVNLEDDITKAELQTALEVTSGAEPNDIDSISVNGIAQTITNKNVDISVPVITYSNVDLTEGTSTLPTGTYYFVYE